MPQGFLIRSNSGTLFTSSSWQWLPGSGSGPVFGTGFPSNAFRIQAARLRYNQVADPSVDLEMRFVDGGGAGITSWTAVTTGGQETVAPGYVLLQSVDISREYRLLWQSLSRGTVPGIEIRGPNVPSMVLEIEAVYEPEAMDVRAAIGGDTVQITITEVESSGTVAMGGLPRSRSLLRNVAIAELGGSTLEGSIFGTSGQVIVGGRTRLSVYWPTRGRVALGGSTREINRFVVPLRLKAAKVTKDVGYMWIPVYLQLPVDEHIADWPWEFYYPDGRKIPFVIRNRVDHQVRALVYMRPSVSATQDFFCRVG